MGCGQGYPGWYTKAAHYKDWISCIIDMSLQFGNNQKKVEEVCNKRARSRATCATPESSIPGCEEHKEFKYCPGTEPGATGDYDDDLDLRQDDVLGLREDPGDV